MIDKSEIKQWLDANIWDGEDRSGCKGDWVKHDPDELQELVEDCFTDLSDQWVSVDDRLPKYDTPVWAELSDGKVVLMDFTSWEEGHGWAMIYDAPHSSHGEWWYESEYDDEYCVVKWKSLPEPPK